MEYPERLKEIDLPTLSYRRVRGDMITVYKIIYGIYHKECCPKLITLHEKTGKIGRHSKSLYQDSSKMDVRKYSFTQRIVAV